MKLALVSVALVLLMVAKSNAQISPQDRARYAKELALGPQQKVGFVKDNERQQHKALIESIRAISNKYEVMERNNYNKAIKMAGQYGHLIKDGWELEDLKEVIGKKDRAKIQKQLDSSMVIAKKEQAAINEVINTNFLWAVKNNPGKSPFNQTSKPAATDRRNTIREWIAEMIERLRSR